MTRTEAVAKIHRLLGFRTGLSSSIESELEGAFRRLANGATNPWFLKSEWTPLTMVASTRTIAVPSDFKQVTDEEGIQVQGLEADSEWVQLRKNDLISLNETYKEEEGLPEGYALSGGYFHLYPMPDAVYGCRLMYHMKDTYPADGDSTSLYLTYVPELVCGMAGLRVAQAVRDKDAQAIFQALETEGKLELYRQNESREHADASYQIGGAH